LRDLRRVSDEPGLERLARRHPDVHAARQLHEHGGRSALEVQCRLLARQTFDEIERATGVQAEGLRGYEGLYFNVTDRLDAPDWITEFAIGWRAFDPEISPD